MVQHYEPGITFETNDSKTKLTIFCTNMNGEKVILFKNKWLEEVKQWAQNEAGTILCIKSYNSWSKKTRVVTIYTNNYHTNEYIYNNDVQIRITDDNRVLIQ